MNKLCCEDCGWVGETKSLLDHCGACGSRKTHSALTRDDLTTEELIDAMRITRHAAECHRVSIVLKGPSHEAAYVKACEDHLDYYDRVMARLVKSGPVAHEGVEYTPESLRAMVTRSGG